MRPLDAALVRRIVEDELGDDPAALFARFDDLPLASASIGQVHRAWRHDGTPVVVKVQRPGIGDLVAKDLRIMHLLARGGERASSAGPAVTARRDPSTTSLPPSTTS